MIKKKKHNAFWIKQKKAFLNAMVLEHLREAPHAQLAAVSPTSIASGPPVRQESVRTWICWAQLWFWTNAAVLVQYVFTFITFNLLLDSCARHSANPSKTSDTKRATTFAQARRPKLSETIGQPFPNVLPRSCHRNPGAPHVRFPQATCPGHGTRTRITGTSITARRIFTSVSWKKSVASPVAANHEQLMGGEV